MYKPTNIQQAKPTLASSVQVTQQQKPILQPQQSVQTYEQLYNALNPYTPPTHKQIEEERRREKRDNVISAISDGVSAISNLYFATKGANNMYEPNKSMSERTRARYDALLKERQDNAQKYMSGLMRVRQMDEEKRNRDASAEESRRKQADDNNKWMYQFRESVRHNMAQEDATDRKNKADQAHNDAMLALRREQQGSKDLRFVLGDTNEMLTIPQSQINESNISLVFSKIPEEERQKYVGTPIYTDSVDALGRSTRVISGYAPPSMEQMMSAIGQNLNNVDVQDALRAISGNPRKKKSNPMVSKNGKKPNPMQ